MDQAHHNHQYLQKENKHYFVWLLLYINSVMQTDADGLSAYSFISEQMVSREEEQPY